MVRRPDTSPQTLLVFESLLAEPGSWQYGYPISKQTGLAPGTLYPILQRLAAKGLLETRWDEPSGPGRPPRHAYRLTADGVPYARERLAERPRTRSAVRPTPRTAS